MRRLNCDRDSHLTHTDKIYYLREAFQNRVADGSWTITETEAEDLLQKAPPGILLQAFTNLGAYVRARRADDLVWYSEGEVVAELLEHHVEAELAKFQKFAA